MVVWWVGDEEVKQHLQNVATPVIVSGAVNTPEAAARRVDFIEAQEQAPAPGGGVVVDTSLWRRDLHNKLTDVEGDPLVVDADSSKRPHIKEVVHIKRSSFVG